MIRCGFLSCASLLAAVAACSGDGDGAATAAQASCAESGVVSTKIAWWASNPTSAIEGNEYRHSSGSKGGPSSNCVARITCDRPLNIADVNALMDDPDVRAALTAPPQYPAAPESFEYQSDRAKQLSIRFPDREIRLLRAGSTCGQRACPPAAAGLVRLAEALDAVDANESQRCTPVP